ncbi:hypothetical protein ACFWXO_24260, partial [Kitasatospora sp. NPDC059088]
MNTDTPTGWSFATARQPATFGACTVEGEPDEPEHAAVGDDRTLCQEQPRTIVRYRHPFGVRVGARFCPRCRHLAAAAPTRPGGPGTPAPTPPAAPPRGPPARPHTR